MSRLFGSWVMLGVMVAVMFGAGCSSSSDDDDGGGSSTAVGEKLEGTWIGYGKKISQDTLNESTAQIEGFQVNEAGEITSVVEDGDWSELSEAIEIHASEEDEIFYIEGEHFGQDEETDFFILSDDGEHIVKYALDDTNDYVSMEAYNLDSSASGEVPDAPTDRIASASLATTWSGLAFDVVVSSPPALNAVDRDATISFTESEQDLQVGDGIIYGGHELDEDGPITLSAVTDDEPDENFGFFTGVDAYVYWLIPSPDLAVVAFIFCAPEEGPGLGFECGDGEGGELELLPGLNGLQGWTFGLLHDEG